MFTLIFFAIALALVWVVTIQPQRRRRQQQAQMLDKLAVGDEVITAGGLYGRVRELREDEVLLEIAPETRVRVARSAVAARIEPAVVEMPAEPS